MEWKDITIEEGQKFANVKQQQINKEQMRLTAAFHMKYGLYKDPAFKFFQSMGMFNFFQGFKNDLSPSNNIKIVAIADPEKINPKGRFVLHIKIEVKRGWHIYSLNAEGDEGESLATRITLKSDLFIPQGLWKESTPTIEWDGALEKVVKTHKQTVEFHRWYRAVESLNTGSYRVKGSVVLRACNNKICNLPSEILFYTDIAKKHIADCLSKTNNLESEQS